MYLIFLCQQVRASSVAGLCYADSSLACGLVSCNSYYKWIWRAKRWLGYRRLALPYQPQIFLIKMAISKTISELLYFPGNYATRAPISCHRCVRSALSHLPPKSIRFTTWKLQHHLYRSLHMLRFFIVIILASAHICMSHKNPILLITFLHGNEGRKLRRLSLAPNESNWSCEAFDVSCLHPIISTSRNVLLAFMCEVVLSCPNTRNCISCSNFTMMPGLGID